MRTKFVCVIVLSLIGFAVGTKRKNVVAFNPQSPVQQKVYIGKPAPHAAVYPFFEVSVSKSLKLAPDQQELYRRMAKFVSEVKALPPARIHFYSGSTYFPRMDRWRGSVKSVVRNGDGTYLVAVKVSPVVCNPDGSGAPIIVFEQYFEIYQIDHLGKARYLESQDPHGQAGKALSTVRA